MTRAKTKSESCSLCLGKHVVLENRGGKVIGELCSCFHCEQCDGSGRKFAQNERGQSYLTLCECAVLQRRLKMLNESGIPGKFVDAELDNYETAKPVHPSQKLAKSRAKDFLKEFGDPKNKPRRGLAFIGGPGLGKTHLVTAIVKALILEQGIDCRFVDFFQLLGDIRHAYSEDRSDQDLIRPYINSQVLVIDELAKGRNNEWERTVLDQFISSRYNAADKITLFTSNFSRDPNGGSKKKKEESHVDTSKKSHSDSLTHGTLQEHIGDRIHSRLVEMCDFIPMEGQDYRILCKPHSAK